MWSDKESSQDYLNFSEVSQLAVDILASADMLPISLGIFGNWGIGKSSLLNLIEADLAEHEINFLVVKFDAWLYQGFDDARAALLEVIARSIAEEVKENKSLLEKAKSLLKRIRIFRVLGLVAEGVALYNGVPTGGLLATGSNVVDSAISIVSGADPSKEDYDEAVKFASDTKTAATAFLNQSEKQTPPQHINAFRSEFGEILEELNKPLVVIIDNLDRCLPANAIQTLEAIRLFLFLPNTAFVIAADEEMIRNAVGTYFKDTSLRHQIDYLDKLIQFPIRVPKAGRREIRSYLFMLYALDHKLPQDKLEDLRHGLETSLQASWKSDPISRHEALLLTGESETSDLAKAFNLADRIAPILATSARIQGNPRIVKRLLNVVKMRMQTAKRRKIPLDITAITKLVIFERCAGSEATADLYRIIDNQSGQPPILEELENNSIDELPADAPKSWQSSDAKEFILEWCKLEPKLSKVDLRPAVYLSRETMPIGVYVVGLSPKGKEALKALTEVRTLSSQAGLAIIQELALEEHVPVMEGLLEHFRKISDWDIQPPGFAGACLLARGSAAAAKILRVYILNLDPPAWMQAMLTEEGWFTD